MAGLTARGLPDAAAASWPRRVAAVAHATLASWRSRCGLSPSPLLEASTNPSIVALNSNRVPSPSRWTWRQTRPVNSPRVTAATSWTPYPLSRGMKVLGHGQWGVGDLGCDCGFRWFLPSCCRCRANTGGQTEYQPDNIAVCPENRQRHARTPMSATRSSRKPPTGCA